MVVFPYARIYVYESKKTTMLELEFWTDNVLFYLSVIRTPTFNCNIWNKR